MATTKSYTDLEQSKKLATILPIETADMYYDDIVDNITGELFTPSDGSSIRVGKGLGGSIAAWSLAALLSVLSNNEHISTTLSKGGYRISPIEYTNNWFVDYEDETNSLNNCVTSAYNPVDACYEMILKLHELKVL